MFNYQKISSEIIKDLPERTKNVIERRFGLKGKKESLEKIGRDYGITRERVRQIESDGLKKMKSKTDKYQTVFQNLSEKIEGFGGIKREDNFLKSLASENTNHVFFLMMVSDSLHRFSGNKDIHPFWANNPENVDYTQKTVSLFHELLNKRKEPISFEECSFLNTDKKSEAILEAVKNIRRNQEGLFGLKNWPEINPRGNKDKAYLVLKREGKPLHFTSIAKLIEGPALPQTVHNELIKDPRFVLVGRGIYALIEWGYKPGQVKDVIIDVLKKSKKPLSKEEVADRVLRQRLVKRNTIYQNLNTKKCFVKDEKGRYFIKNYD